MIAGSTRGKRMFPFAKKDKPEKPKNRAEHKKLIEDALPQVKVEISEDGMNYLVIYPVKDGFFQEPISRQSTKDQVRDFVMRLHPQMCQVSFPAELG